MEIKSPDPFHSNCSSILEANQTLLVNASPSKATRLNEGLAYVKYRFGRVENFRDANAEVFIEH